MGMNGEKASTGHKLPQHIYEGNTCGDRELVTPNGRPEHIQLSGCVYMVAVSGTNTSKH